jgi:DNA-binding transcriptional LysR family regulator
VAETVRAARALPQSERFDPSTARGPLRIAAPDVISLLLLPALLPMLEAQAPGIALEVTPRTSEWRAQLAQGRVDLILGFPSGTEPDLHARPLLTLDWAVLLPRAHPCLSRRWTPALYASLPHAIVTQLGAPASELDQRLAALGYARRPALSLGHALLAPMLTARASLVSTTMLWLARALAVQHELAVRPLPFAAPPVRAQMVWHERAHSDRRHRWTRALVQSAAESIDPRALRW